MCVVTAGHGWARNDGGLQLSALLSSNSLPEGGRPPAIGSLAADVLIEVTTLNPRTGQPALDHLRQALEAGMHVVTANKGPIAYDLQGLQREGDIYRGQNMKTAWFKDPDGNILSLIEERS